MATTSGLYNNITLTAQDVITAALKRCRVLSAGGVPSVNDLTDCLLELNNMLKMWETKGRLLWLNDLIQVPLITNKMSYTIGPNADVNPGYRPLRIFEGSYIRYTCSGACPPDTQLLILSRLEYDQFTQKCALGIPNSIYYDPQMGLGNYDPYAHGWGVLYVWTAPSDLTRTIFLEVQRPIQDVSAAGVTFDLPLEWYYALVKCLAAEVADLYEIPEDRITRIKREGEMALEYIADWGATEQAPFTFQPDYQQGMR
jgi:hypothetical protein